jgi:hypothetical protein
MARVEIDEWFSSCAIEDNVAEWDGSTYFGTSPSNSSTAQTRVVGSGTNKPVGFRLKDLMALWFRSKIAKIETEFSFAYKMEHPSFVAESTLYTGMDGSASMQMESAFLASVDFYPIFYADSGGLDYSNTAEFLDHPESWDTMYKFSEAFLRCSTSRQSNFTSELWEFPSLTFPMVPDEPNYVAETQNFESGEVEGFVQIVTASGDMDVMPVLGDCLDNVVTTKEFILNGPIFFYAGLYWPTLTLNFGSEAFGEPGGESIYSGALAFDANYEFIKRPAATGSPFYRKAGEVVGEFDFQINGNSYKADIYSREYERISMFNPDGEGDLELTTTIYDIECECILTIEKWWPYEDADGNPLYDEDTGLPI